MKYTQEQLESMSDLDLNKSASVALGEYEEIPNHGEPTVVGDKEAYYDDARNIFTCHKDYCNNWEDCGDLIDELHDLEQVSYEVMEDKSICLYCALDNDSFSLDKFHVKNQEHKRAVAIVYILVKQSNG